MISIEPIEIISVDLDGAAAGTMIIVAVRR
jgi:hypothetical protein